MVDEAIEWVSSREALDFLQPCYPSRAAAANDLRNHAAGAGVATIARRAVELGNRSLLGGGGDVVASHVDWTIPPQIWSAVSRADPHTLSGWDAGSLIAPTGFRKALQLTDIRFDRTGLEALAIARGAQPNRATPPVTSSWITSAEALKAIQRTNPGVGWGEHISLLAQLAARGRVRTRCMVGDLVASEFRGSREQSEDASGDIPAWVWAKGREADAHRLDLQAGSFSGRAFNEGRAYSFKFSRITVSEDDLRRELELDEGSDDDRATSTLPPLSDGELNRWWDALTRKGVADGLTQDQLLILVRGEHPNNHIARRRIEMLTAGRKRGPKAAGE